MTEPSSSKLRCAEDLAGELGAAFVHTRVPIIAVDEDGHIAAANGATCTQYGYTLEELVSMRIHDLQAVERPIDEELAIAIHNEIGLPRRPHRRKNGTIVWVTPTVGPIVLGNRRLMLSVLNDVTAVLRAEERAEVVWEAASERLSDGVVLLDAERRIIRMNGAERARLGLSDAEVHGKRCDEIMQMCRDVSPCAHEVALKERLRLVREFPSNEAGCPLRVEIIPAQPTDTEIAIVHVSHDLTEERAIRSRLVTADRLATIGRLASGVAHEVNNPAAFVTVNLGVMRDRFASGAAHAPEMLAMLEDSLTGMDRIREIVRDLKGFARERARNVTDLSQIAASAIRLAAHETRGRARVEKHLGEDVLAEVRGARIAQVVLNLIINAAQAIPTGGPNDHRIAVRTERTGDCVQIEVSDTGPGVPRELASRIFEPFFTTREAVGGTGLGLWLARSIVEEEGGTLTLRDGGERPGASFIVELPAAKR